jgi:hypothetical protein
MVSKGRPKRINPDTLRDRSIKLHVSKKEKELIEKHFGKGNVSRKVRELLLDHIYACEGC